MTVIYFAHNGAQHATSAEEVSHSLHTFLVVGIFTVVTALVVFTVMRRLSPTFTEVEDDTEEET